jgi:hypothetical protein
MLNSKISMNNLTLPKNTGKNSGVTVELPGHGTITFGHGSIDWYKAKAKSLTRSYTWKQFASLLNNDN